MFRFCFRTWIVSNTRDTNYSNYSDHNAIDRHPRTTEICHVSNNSDHVSGLEIVDSARPYLLWSFFASGWSDIYTSVLNREYCSRTRQLRYIVRATDDA